MHTPYASVHRLLTNSSMVGMVLLHYEDNGILQSGQYEVTKWNTRGIQRFQGSGRTGIRGVCIAYSLTFELMFAISNVRSEWELVTL